MSLTAFKNFLVLCLEPYFNKQDVTTIILAYLTWDTLSLPEAETQLFPMALLDHNTLGDILFSVETHICFMTLPHDHALMVYDLKQQKISQFVVMEHIRYPLQIQRAEHWLLIRGVDGIEIFQEKSLISQGLLGTVMVCMDFAIDASRGQIYVCDMGSNEIVQFDWCSRKRVYSWSCWRPRAIISHQQQLLVTHDAGPSLTFYDLQGTIVRTFGFPGSSPWNKMYLWDKTLLGVYDERQGYVSLYETLHMNCLSKISFQGTLAAFCTVPGVIDEILLLSYENHTFKQKINTLKIH